MAAQAGLCLAWSETPEDTFCRVVAHSLIYSLTNQNYHVQNNEGFNLGLQPFEIVSFNSSFIYGLRQANLVLIAYASSEGSGEPAHLRSLARTFAARSYKQ